MSDLLTAAGNIRNLLAAFDGLRVLAPILEKVGSLDQSAKEATKLHAEASEKYKAILENIKKVNEEHSSKVISVDLMIQEATAKRDEIVRLADEQSAKLLDKAQLTASDILNEASIKAKEVIDICEKSLSENIDKLKNINEEIAVKEEKLTNIRDAIAKLTNG